MRPSITWQTPIRTARWVRRSTRLPVNSIVPLVIAALRTQQIGDRLQRRRLAGAVRAEERDDPPLGNLERHALQHEDHVIVDDLDVVDERYAGVAGCGTVDMVVLIVVLSFVQGSSLRFRSRLRSGRRRNRGTGGLPSRSRAAHLLGRVLGGVSSTILRTIARSPANGVTCLLPVPSHIWI